MHYKYSQYVLCAFTHSWIQGYLCVCVCVCRLCCFLSVNVNVYWVYCALLSRFTYEYDFIHIYMYRGVTCATCCDTRAGKALRWLIYMCVLILLYTCPDTSASQARPRVGASFKTTRGSRALRSCTERSTSAGAPPPALSPRCQIFLTHTHTHTHNTHAHLLYTHTHHTHTHTNKHPHTHTHVYMYMYVCI